jgi:hypothetical protein
MLIDCLDFSDEIQIVFVKLRGNGLTSPVDIRQHIVIRGLSPMFERRRNNRIPFGISDAKRPSILPDG